MKILYVILFLLIMTMISSTMFAQDIIVMKDGSLVKSKIYEITSTGIKYKKFSNLAGPFYTIEKSMVLAVNYENGEKDVFSDVIDEQKDIQTDASSRYIEVLPDVDNVSIIAQYNQLVTFEGKISRKEAKNIVCKYGITNESVLSNKDVEIRFEMIHSGYCCQYGISVRNKTEKVIYIDLGNTFRIKQNGESYVFHDASKQTTVAHGNASGVSIGLGSVANVLGIGGAMGMLANGISVGGGKQHSVSTTYSPQRIIAIAPHGKSYLSMHKEVENKCLSHCENFFDDLSSVKCGFIKKGETRIFTEKESIAKRDYIITYSTQETFNSYSTIKFGLFVQQVYGEDFIYWFEGDIRLLEKAIKKTVPDYTSFSILGSSYLEK